MMIAQDHVTPSAQGCANCQGAVSYQGVTQLGIYKHRRNGASDARRRAETTDIGLNGAKRFGLGQALTLTSPRKSDEICPLEIHEHGVPPLTALVDNLAHKLVNIVQLQRSFDAGAEKGFGHA